MRMRASAQAARLARAGALGMIATRGKLYKIMTFGSFGPMDIGQTLRPGPQILVQY